MIRKYNIALAVATVAITGLIGLTGLIFVTVALPNFVSAHGVDGDGDLYSLEDGDCNDEDPTIFPGAVEIPNDGIDQNCDGAESPGIGAVPLIGGVVAVLIVLGAAGWYAKGRWMGKQQPSSRRRRRR
ncbi:MAG: putative metal-binding motif-containing protein [Chloroflexi bacterium]|nr:putative metal-binding motif-containing protein [Chloroflexota bacterium]